MDVRVERTEDLQYIGFGRHGNNQIVSEETPQQENKVDKSELLEIVNSLTQKYGVQELIKILKNWL